MQLPSLKAILLVPVAAFFIVYAFLAIFLLLKKPVDLAVSENHSTPIEIAILGASGTAGDGILKAALASPHITKIDVITRRITPRIQAGVDLGKVKVSLHQDYLDYSDVMEELANVDAVYWAIGISSLGVDEATYGMIHVDFPMQFVREWSQVSDKPSASFHYISSSDISDESSAMWAREKVRAEKALFSFGEDNMLRVIAYRPDYIGPTAEEAHLGQKLLYVFFRPVGAAVKATEIGWAMIDITKRTETVLHGSKLSTRKIVQHAKVRDGAAN